MNPRSFLKKFNQIAAHERVDEIDQLYFFGKCMSNQAAMWFETREFQNITEAREEFANYFWGENQEAKFRKKLYLGKFKANKKTHAWPTTQWM